ncbi:MAG: type II secretion system F family protein [Actinomycetota bacterium]
MRRRIGRRRVAARAARAAGVGRFVRARSRAARSWSTDDLLVGRCAMGAVIVAFLLATASHGARAVAAIPLGLGIGWRAGRAWHERFARADAKRADDALPEALDRIGACVRSGMSIERALRLVAPGTPGPLGDALTEGLRALDVGVPRSRAYATVAERAGSADVRALMDGLARAERFGTPVAATLDAHAEEVRAKARAAAEADARTAPVKLIFPLVFCFLPAFVLLTIAPVAISAIRTLSNV